MMTIEEISKNTKMLRTTMDRVSYIASVLDTLTYMHQENCEPYRKIVASFFSEYQPLGCIEQIPFIPIGLFKQLELKSVPSTSIVRTLNSSGTSGRTSSIFLDKVTAINQIKVLTEIFQQSVSSEKIPMIVVDQEFTSGPEDSINARLAAVKGFSSFASAKHFLIDQNSKIKIDLLKEMQKSHENSNMFFFGFTFSIWNDLLDKLEEEGVSFNFPKATMIHGGGWKKLAELAVSNEEFKARVKDRLGVNKVLNYYGMAEQTGSLYFECEESYLHTTPFGHIIIRDFKDLSVSNIGVEGVVQVLSVIPRSYPGHSILTEDVGLVIGDDGCKCGKPGRYFRILGRLPEAEIRGCSDVYGNS
jgi:phenylacetate-coenzyme A ligase PaaK-like adenylate-forming protein